MCVSAHPQSRSSSRFEAFHSEPYEGQDIETFQLKYGDRYRGVLLKANITIVY